MCANTVSRHVKKLEERGLIAVEPTKVATKAGVTRNGTLQFTLLPPQNVIPTLRRKVGGTGTDSGAPAGTTIPGAANQKHPVFSRVRRCVPSFGAGHSPAPSGVLRQIWHAIGSDESTRRGRKKRQDKGKASSATPFAGHNCPQCGQFQEFPWALEMGSKSERK